MSTIRDEPVALSGWDLPDPPFHEGELAVQRRLGVEQKMAAVGRRVIRRFMPEQHREFFPLLSMLVFGGIDEAGQPWASLLTGPPGFVDSPDPQTLRLRAESVPGDPLDELLARGGEVGLLGLDLSTRRRNRMNGRMSVLAPDVRMVQVHQSFGNCPKYIQVRELSLAPACEPGEALAARSISTSLSADDIALVSGADIFFIASSSGGQIGPAAGADVSHRGGRPGFVRVTDAGRQLLVPDFVGNSLYNTLGNLCVEPRAGLLFIDWRTGDLLHVAASAEILWLGPEVDAYPGAQRLVRLSVRSVVRRPGALPLRGPAQGGLSPYLELPGER